jgi:hypothetical protein
MSVVVWLERSNLEFLRIRGFVRRTFESPWRSLVILSGINGLWATVFQWGSIPTSSQWLPDLVIVLYYTMFYALGWLIYTSQLDLARVRDYAWTLIGVGLTLSAVYFIATKHLGEEDKSSGVFIVRALAMSGALIAMTRGLMGVFLKHANTGSYGWRYISDASYWVYLFHVFTCWTFPYFLSGWVAPVLLKYLTSILLSLIACLTTYDLYVRSTWIGKLLNGRRYARYSLRLSLMSLVLIFGFAAIGWGHISERNALLVDWKKAGGPMAFIPNADSVIAAGPGTKIPLDGPGDLSRCIPLGRYVHCATAVDRSRARAVCTAWGGQLLIAETEAEHELITDLVVGYTGKPYWVDIDDRETEGKWLWGNGAELAYNRWDVTQPNSHGENEDCAAANFGGGTRWHDVSCKSRFHFVCEEKTGPPSGRPIK